MSAGASFGTGLAIGKGVPGCLAADETVDAMNDSMMTAVSQPEVYVPRRGKQPGGLGLSAEKRVGMEIVWRNPNNIERSEVSVFSIGLLQELSHVCLFYLSSTGHGTFRTQYEVLVNPDIAGNRGKRWGISCGASSG